MQRSNNLIAWVLLTALSFSAAAQEKHAFSLQQAIDYGKKNNVQVKNALLDVQIQAQTNREVTGSALPQLKSTGSLVYNAKLQVNVVDAGAFGGTPGVLQEFTFGVKWS